MTLAWERICDRDSEVRDMARRLARGELADASLSEHVAGCESCQDTMTIAGWMQQLSSMPIAGKPLPDPTYLWWKAELLRRWDAEHRASAPLEMGEQVQVGIGLVAALGLLVWLWRNLFPASLSPSDSAAPLAIVMLLSAGLLAATAAVMIRNLIRREE
jgi:hypothetical protein